MKNDIITLEITDVTPEGFGVGRIDGKVYFTSPKRLKDGEFVQVTITEVLDYDLLGKLA